MTVIDPAVAPDILIHNPCWGFDQEYVGFPDCTIWDPFGILGTGTWLQ